MVSPALKSHFERRGVSLIPLELGAQRLVEELASPAPGAAQVLVGSTLDGVEHVAETGFHVGTALQPYLLAHRIDGVAVVPVALAIEWFGRAVRALRPDLRLASLRDLKVLRGIRLPPGDGSEPFRVRSHERQAHNGVELSLELVGPSGAVHYRALAALNPATKPASGKRPEPKLGPWTAPAIYDGHVLFHGPLFQAVHAVEGISDEGLVGTLGGVRDLGWTPDDWALDPPALDGVLQLAVLWATRMLGSATLPTAVGELALHGALPASGQMRCVVHRTSVQLERATCEARLFGPDGEPLVSLTGVDLHVRPDSPRTTAPARAVEAR
jgi:hypothetical protein